MKKIYNAPSAELVELESAPVMTTFSLPSDGGGEDEGRGDSEFQGAGEHRCDWSGIWDGM